MGVAHHLGILRCVTKDGNKVTFVGDPDSTNDLVRSGAAGNPQGIAIAKKDFPVIVEGWLFRIREDYTVAAGGKGSSPRYVEVASVSRAVHVASLR
jgi:hypothetical protein